MRGEMAVWEWIKAAAEKTAESPDSWHQVVMAVAAVVALVYAIVQVRSQRKDAREQTAKEIWKQYHLTGLEYPYFSEPEVLVTLNFEKKTLNGDYEKFLKYTWFVSLLLVVCD